VESFAYAPGAYRQFLVHEPKRRLVSAAPFRDRVVHHALIAVIPPPLERRFCRVCRDHRWILQADIRQSFPSIDHRLLRGQLKALIACPGDTLLTPSATSPASFWPTSTLIASIIG
jgi:RNA-directed DNA polymerase